MHGQRLSLSVKEPRVSNARAGPPDELSKLSDQYFKRSHGRIKSKQPVSGVTLQRMNVLQMVHNEREARKKRAKTSQKTGSDAHWCLESKKQMRLMKQAVTLVR